MFFGLFEDKKSKQPPLPNPLNLRTGCAVELDLLPFQMLEQKLQMALPEGIQTIEAAGFIDLGAGATISRFYTADDGFIQISTTGGYGIENIDDIKLFTFEQTHSIASQKGADYWSSEQGLIGQPLFKLENTDYQRVWDAPVNGKIEPVNFIETVKSRDTSIASYEVEHLSMLYQRPIDSCDRQEYLLVSLEFTGDDEATAVVSLGIDLDRSSMQIM